MDTAAKKVMLREERDGKDSRFLWAYLDAAGDLHIDGQDLGSGTAMVSGDGEYEWFQKIRASDLPQLVAALGGAPTDRVLELLALRYTGQGSYDLERILRSSGIPIERQVW